MGLGPSARSPSALEQETWRSKAFHCSRRAGCALRRPRKNWSITSNYALKVRSPRKRGSRWREILCRAGPCVQPLIHICLWSGGSKPPPYDDASSVAKDARDDGVGADRHTMLSSHN